MIDTNADLIKYRISKAYMVLEEVEVLCQNNYYSAAISRLYFACFHAVIAILTLLGYSAKTHKGTMVLLYQHIVSNGILSQEQSKFYSSLFQARHENDYDDFIEPDSSTLPDWQIKAKEFIDTINDHITNELSSNENKE
ncbi:MAG: HEPN domain-containing protein [bacterium]